MDSDRDAQPRLDYVLIKITFFSATWTPPDPFLPCSQLEGLPVRIDYHPLSGKRYAGEVSRIEVTKKK